jgi:uncharacterized membrane protein
MIGRNLKLALAVSLAANIFLVGGAAGALGFHLLRPKAEAVGPGSPGVPRAQAQRRALRFAADELSPELRRQFRQSLREAWRDTASDSRTAREQRLALAELLAQPSTDRARVEAAMAGARQADMAVRARVEQAVADFAAGLSPQDREVFVTGLKHSGGLLRVPARAATGNAATAR